MARLLEIGRDDASGIDSRNTEGHQHRRDVDLLEGTAHRVLAADRGQSQLDLHLQGTEQRPERLAPRTGRLGHALEILLIGIAHLIVAGTRRHDFGRSVHDA